jgi:predicted RNase H-like HicB family nuclease
MKDRFMVIYENGKRNYSGFAPDVLGCGSVGDTLTEMRSMMKEALEAHLELMAENGDDLPKPATTSFDFGEIRDESVDHYVVEWLEIEVPELHHAESLQ